MADAATTRVWTSLTDDEAEEVARAAKARGLRPSELARMALLSYIRQPVAQAGATNEVPIPLPPVLARLEALAETLGHHVEAIGRALPVMKDNQAEHEVVRETLEDIAVAVGTLAGAIEPADRTDGGGTVAENFG